MVAHLVVAHLVVAHLVVAHLVVAHFMVAHLVVAPLVDIFMTGFNPKIHHRRSIRLKEYDYSQAGLYFITICTHNRERFFGDIDNSKMILNHAGIMVENEWLKLKNRYPNIDLHEYIVMPNHFHGVIQIVTNGQPQNGQPQDGQPQDGQPQDGQPQDGQPQNGQPQNGQPQNGQPQDGQPQDGQPQDGQPQDGQPQDGQPQGIAPTVGNIIGAFKSLVMNEYIRNVKQKNWQRFNGKLWQRNYHEHIIRDKKSYLTIAEYIQTNPLKWQNDKYHI